MTSCPMSWSTSLPSSAPSAWLAALAAAARVVVLAVAAAVVLGGVFAAGLAGRLPLPPVFGGITILLCPTNWRAGRNRKASTTCAARVRTGSGQRGVNGTPTLPGRAFGGRVSTTGARHEGTGMTSTSTSRTTAKARSPLPILQGVLPLDPVRVPVDIIAGATLAALAIPEVMGYTKIAGMPVVTGLYTLLLPVLLFAIFGSSRHLVVGADSATAAILATGLAGDRGGRGLARVHGAGRPRRADVRCHPARGPPAAARVHRQLPVAQRPHRVPHGCRHPGRDGPGGGHVRGRCRQRHHAREVRQHAPRDRCR